MSLTLKAMWHLAVWVHFKEANPSKCYGGDPMQAQVPDWRILSEAASREQDPEKLIKLVEELNRALLHRELRAKRAAAAN